MEELHYRIPWRTQSHRGGMHLSRQRGEGGRFLGYGALLDHPDPRRLDLRASLVSLEEQLRVRLHHQRGAIDVWALVDLSASMAFQDKLAVAADFIAALGNATHRASDRFGLLAAGDEAPTEGWLQRPRHGRGLGLAWAERLRRLTPHAEGVQGLIAALDALGQRRSLVFLLSDFCLAEADLEALLERLQGHDVVAVWLVAGGEQQLPRWGLMPLYDPETGAERLLLLTPRRQRQLQARWHQRQEALRGRLQRRGMRSPLVLHNGFCADQVTRYFYG